MSHALPCCASAAAGRGKADATSDGATIYYAEKMGEFYDLEAAGWVYPFHLLIAKVTIASYLVVIGSGLATIKQSSRRRTHGRIAYSVIVLTVLTAITGTWMILAATPLE